MSVTVNPTNIPAITPGPFARFHQTPKINAGKNVPEAKANAHATICVMAPGGSKATIPAATVAMMMTLLKTMMNSESK